MKILCTAILFVFFAQLTIGQSVDNQNSPFGIHDPTIPQVDKVEDLVSLGIAWVRYPGSNGITWDMIESQAGQYHWVRDELYLQTYTNKIKMNVVVLAYNRNDGAELGYLPKNLQWYREFLSKTVEHYNGNGVDDAPGSPVIDVWEIGNEEDTFWHDTPENYALLLKESYKIIKSINPNARVAFAGLAGPAGIDKFFIPVLNELERIKDSEDQKYFDVCGFHWSGQFKGNYQSEVFPSGSWSLDSVVNRMNTEMSARGYENIPIWIGEMSYNDGKPTDMMFLPAPRKESEQAAELLKRYVYSIVKGVEKIFWITLTEWHNFGGGGVGTYFDCVGLINNPTNDNQSHKKLSYYTYKKMAEVLEGSDWNNIQTVQESNDFYIYKFTKNGAPIWVAWNDSTITRTVTISGITSNQVKVTEAVPKYESGKDVMDYTTAFQTDTLAIANGVVTLTLSDRPVFVEPQAVTSIERNDENIPQGFFLYQNYPNPFNPTTNISISLTQHEQVTLKVFDILGREVTTLVDGELSAGEHSALFDARNLSSGVYFYQLRAAGFIQTKKMLIAK